MIRDCPVWKLNSKTTQRQGKSLTSIQALRTQLVPLSKTRAAKTIFLCIPTMTQHLICAQSFGTSVLLPSLVSKSKPSWIESAIRETPSTISFSTTATRTRCMPKWAKLQTVTATSPSFSMPKQSTLLPSSMALSSRLLLVLPFSRQSFTL